MNKNLIITGGTRGIGKAILEQFASHGFNVITCSRNADHGAKIIGDLSKNYNKVSIRYFNADLSRKDDCQNFISFVKDQIENVDVLVNNTGTFKPGLIHTEEDGVLEEMLNTNLYSAYYVTRGLVQSMKEAGQGHIFNICSTASIMAYTSGGSYCISKFALLGMSKVLREELKEFNIRVTAVLPGATLTDSWRGAGLPEARFMKPEDVGQSVYDVYSLSEQTVVEELLLRPQLGDI